MRTKADASRDESETPEALLERYLAGQAVFRRYAPKGTVGASMLFTLIARRTLNRGSLDLPTPKQMAEALDLSQSGINHLLASLTAQGRTKAGAASTDEGNGYGLIETNNWLQGRRIVAYVLTQKGRACLNEMVQALAGDRPIEALDPHDGGSLAKLIFAQAGS